MKFRHIPLAVAAIAAAVLPFATAGVADASTVGCLKGVYSGYCGTQADTEATPLALDVFRQSPAVNNKIIGFANSSTDPATDFFTFAYQGGEAKVFEYAPNGNAKNVCVSDPGNGLVVLRTCNGSKWQQWTASEVDGGFTWTNAATGNVLKINGNKNQVTTVALGSSAPTAAEVFNFAG